MLPDYSKHPSPAAPGKKKEEVGPTGLGGAGRPKIWPKNFEFFLWSSLDANFQSLNVLWLKIKYVYVEVKQKFMQGKFKLSYMQCDDGYCGRTA